MLVWCNIFDRTIVPLHLMEFRLWCKLGMITESFGLLQSYWLASHIIDILAQRLYWLGEITCLPISLILISADISRCWETGQNPNRVLLHHHSPRCLSNLLWKQKNTQADWWELLKKGGYLGEENIVIYVELLFPNKRSVILNIH